MDALLDYFRLFYLEMERGISFIPTQIAVLCAVPFLLNDTEKTPKGIARKLLECLVCFLLAEAGAAAAYALLGDHHLGRWQLLAFITVYAVFFSRYKPRTRLVRSAMYLAGYMVILSISEPLGVLVSRIDERYWPWAQHLTWLVVVLLIVILVCFLRHFSPHRDRIIATQFSVLICVICGLIIASQMVFMLLFGSQDMAETDITYKTYNLIISVFLLIIGMLAYYFYYSVAQATQENINLLALQHRTELEAEKFEANRVNYEDLRTLRHELKNHIFYMRSLLQGKRYDELTEYLDSAVGAQADALQSFDSGNYTVDIVMNHAVNEARQRGVEIGLQIIVPHHLPYEDNDLCSLLSNLMDNAIEAAAASGAAHPTVDVSILPRQDYLFITVSNDVNQSISRQQRLTLRTTKEDQRVHGYGTRVIRAIAKKYSGSVKFDMKDGRFAAYVMLELPADREEEGEA